MALKVFAHLMNIGVVDVDKLHRVDLERMRLAAEDQTNLLCDTIGRAWFRQGTEYLSTNANPTGKARLLPFIAGQMDAFQLELSDLTLRVRDGQTDELVTRETVSTAVTSGDFSASTGWTLSSASGQTSAISGGKLNLTARARGATAQAKATVTVAGGDQGVEHAFRIVVDRGPVTFRAGSSDGADDYIAETTLRTGEHSLAFTPTGGSVYIRFNNALPILKIVDSITVEAAGVMELPTIWAADDLYLLRPDQSLDVMFIAARGYKQQRIERRSDTSWSVCDYDADDGPFISGRTANVTLTPSVLEGNGTLTASDKFFQPEHVGALFRLYHEGQDIDTYIAADNQFTPAIMVTGINETNYNDRDFTWTTAGTWVGTVKVQRSFEITEDLRDPLIGYQEFRREQGASTIDITTNLTKIDDDNEDNVIAFYRMGIEEGDYTSGEVHITMSYGGGGGFGICRVVGYTSPTVVDIEVLTPFKGSHAVTEWREGMWSDVRGWPSAIAFDEGRLDFAGDDSFQGSISDAYENFDEDFIGDAGPLLRAIALGGRNEARWMVPLSNLMLGTDNRIAAVRASSLDEIKTPENFKVAHLAKVGVAEISPVRVSDDRALFVEKAGNAIYELTYSPQSSQYVATQLSKLTTDLFAAGVTDLAVSDQPDQRIWATTTDGNAVCIVYEPSEKVIAFIPIETAIDGSDVIESVCVLPGLVQDRVYFSVRRTIDGVETRYTEKLALDTEAKPDTVAKCFDAHVSGTGSHSATFNAPHLIGRNVRAWVDGAPVLDDDGEPLDFLVDNSGDFTLPDAPTTGWCFGLPYRGRYKSARLEYGAPDATPVLTNKNVSKVGFLFSDYCRSGVRIGGEFDNDDHPLRRLTALLQGGTAANVVSGVVEAQYPQSFGGKLSLDTRVCLEVQSPNTLGLLGMVLAIEGYGG